MARSIETEIEINGTATQVWEVLTDFGRYWSMSAMSGNTAGDKRWDDRKIYKEI